ncbi:MAG TPA: class I SAM-dependent RNA methyltransferase [Blastocatellia bacterium]|nr:class I SAM-dependent RNA methyltransferase [Blastocatellia bacterium]
MKQNSLSVGDVVEVTTERLAFGGDAVARHDGLAIFVPFAAPAERLRIRITERKKNFARGVIEEIITPSPSRRAPPCRYFGECGGCQLQHLSYDEQLKAKAGFVGDALARIGRIPWDREIEIRSAAEFGYRSRAQVKIEHDADHLRIGFNHAASHAVCDVESCPVLAPQLDRALVSLRSSFAGGGFGSELPAEVEMALGQSGVSIEPELEGFSAAPVSRKIGDMNYTFGASTFFQANYLLLEDFVKEATAGYSGDVACDLYAGVGLFTLPLALSFDRVIGVESDPRAAYFAKKNIAASNAANVELRNTRVESWLKGINSAPDLILLDPPRSGAAEAIGEIARLKPARVAYVSCDPATLARDLRKLVDARYRLSSVVAFDLFPQTYHVETVAKLDLDDE